MVLLGWLVALWVGLAAAYNPNEEEDEGPDHAVVPSDQTANFFLKIENMRCHWDGKKLYETLIVTVNDEENCGVTKSGAELADAGRVQFEEWKKVGDYCDTIDKAMKDASSDSNEDLSGLVKQYKANDCTVKDAEQHYVLVVWNYKLHLAAFAVKFMPPSEPQKSVVVGFENNDGEHSYKLKLNENGEYSMFETGEARKFAQRQSTETASYAESIRNHKPPLASDEDEVDQVGLRKVRRHSDKRQKSKKKHKATEKSKGKKGKKGKKEK